MAQLEPAHQECAAAIGKPRGDKGPRMEASLGFVGSCCVCLDPIAGGSSFVMLVTGTPWFDKARKSWVEDGIKTRINRPRWKVIPPEDVPAAMDAAREAAGLPPESEPDDAPDDSGEDPPSSPGVE